MAQSVGQASSRTLARTVLAWNRRGRWITELIRDTLGDPKLAKQVAAASEELINHPIYHTLKTPSDLCIYMEQHVFAVWDFMSLLKRLQQDLTSVQIPWLPSANPEFTRFINEIVLDEESDQDGEGTHISHFMLYRQAMAEVGADQEPIQNFLALVAQAVPVGEALAVVPLAENTAQFVHSTIELAHNGATHEVAAAFFYGRENVIPDMFGQMIAEASGKSTASRFVYYLRRHIELDGDQHGPLAENLLRSLCGDNPDRWNEALNAAHRALTARIALWNGILAKIAAAH